MHKLAIHQSLNLTAISLLLGISSLHAQEGVTQIQGQNATVANEGLTSAITTLETQIVSATNRLMIIKSCHEQGKLFGPLSDGTEGCISLIISCEVPWSHAAMKPGETVTAYQAATVPYGQTCATEVRTCTPDTMSLTGSYTYQNCTTGQGLDCPLPWGGTISSTSSPIAPSTSSTSVIAYQSSTVPYGTACASETRVCMNGSLSGSYTKTSCSVTPAANCTDTPWGTVAHNASVTGYKASSVPTGSSCDTIKTTLTCLNGTISGSTVYKYASCAPVPSTCTLPCGGTIANGQSVTAYSESAVYPLDGRLR